ncbi:unnamed protein product [Mytilus edulis]|uniref:Uncharacterized protein n=1 Tax=Mytilus edulis TaxID=6550 RepID=A0A8S3QQ09_MYTED|nr:unnamed protein product [Mytilus edulis]
MGRAAESFDMRCMVTGQFSVGKSTLVKLLFNALDVVYAVGFNDLSGRRGGERTNQKSIKASDTSPTGYAKASLSSLPSEQSATAQSLPSTKSSNMPHTIKQMENKMRTRMTKEEIRKKMEKVLKSGKYKMKVGRLIFWDFGGQYILSNNTSDLHDVPGIVSCSI